MKKTLAIVILLLGRCVSFAQEFSFPQDIKKSTKSYLIADYNPKDTAFLKENCRRAGLDLGLSVLANRIPTDSKLVSPIPSENLLKQGTLSLQLPMDDRQTEFAVYHTELFDTPANINVLQIGDELITYRTTERAGNINMFYQCVRGAFGTRKYAHPENAVVYKLWDTPERTLLPDYELQEQMVLEEAKKLAKIDCPLLIFNDLKSYAYNGQGDTAIVRMLDTMHKYNPGKLLQADLLTPNSRHYLSRINENQLWNATMRTKIVETLTERQQFYRDNAMPWMIGNFKIHLADKYRKATTLEELEWFLSKAAAFDAGFGLIFSTETMKEHGLTDEMLDAINIWETLRLSGAFSEEQKEQFKDPYANWHIEKLNDSTSHLFEQQTSRRYVCEPEILHCDPKSMELEPNEVFLLSENSPKPKKYADGTFDSWGFMRGKWNWKSPYNSTLFLMVAVEGKGSISNLRIITKWGDFTLDGSVKTGQYLIFDKTYHHAIITDHNFNILDRIPTNSPKRLMEGDNIISFFCSFVGEKDKIPEVSVRYIIRGNHETILSK